MRMPRDAAFAIAMLRALRLCQSARYAHVSAVVIMLRVVEG